MSNKGFSVEGKGATYRERKMAHIETMTLREKARKQRWAKKSWFLSNIEIECQLYRGESEFPRTKKMTCKEMGQDNRRLVHAFIKALDEGKDSPLWAWKIKDLPKFRRVKDSYMNA